MADNAMVVGSANVGGQVYEPWPNYWPNYWPNSSTYVYWTPGVVEKDYANRIEVERGEHDATLRFYRRHENSQSLVKEITIPLSLLDWLTTAEES